MKLAELTWQDAGEVSKDVVVLVPTGSLEQHGPHLPLFTDTFLATAAAEAVESRIPEAVRKQLLARGHKLRVTGAWSDGALAAIVVDLKTGVLNAGTDPRVEAHAWAW